MTPERINQNPQIPETIRAPYPFVAVGDIAEIIDSVAPAAVPEKYKLYAQIGLYDLQRDLAPDRVSFTSIPANEITRELERRIEAERLADPRMGTVIMDRYISSSSGDSDVFRLEISREAGGNGVVARPGAKLDPATQLERMFKWAKDGRYRTILFVDDVLAFGDTMGELAEVIRSRSQELEVRILVGLAASGGGWRGKEKVYEETGVMVESVCTLMACPANEWTTGMAVPTSRDFTVFGGKIVKTNGGIARSLPYFLPYSKANISFISKDKRIEGGFRTLAYNRQLVQLIEEFQAEPLRLYDLVEAGYAIPSSNIENVTECFIKPDLRMTVVDFINYSEEILNELSALPNTLKD